MPLDVLYEDNHLLVVNKPAGLATMGDGDRATLHSLAGSYLKEKYEKPHGVYVGIVSRLDSLVSGVIVLARTSKAAARLNAQFAGHARDLNSKTGKPAGGGEPAGGKNRPPSIRKTYLAVARAEPHRSAPLADRGQLDDFLYKDDDAHRMRAARTVREDAKAASLLFQTLASSDHSSVLAIAPLTGRKHQIRVQLAARGWPILGDRKYGSQTPWPTGIALHSHRLTIEHPTRREPMTFVAPLPVDWNRVRSRELLAKIDALSW
ncbi:RluA family pseudouridine synthase [Allorhodopirellula solitaria]|uniref:Ribosomal large subunit pseudouridine synthase A n=1 Tax=Allorhodopirellula solitaria TaxID=2527987 RepID=A0A5C5YJZ7_9BACT|nr:RluA family pseudouridine synthase [Allorhodopirellula solitaria]TWT75157.1 Ribosomal large subunit pseudouridine synthase A [Allorhodopirellula solitaria]